MTHRHLRVVVLHHQSAFTKHPFSLARARGWLECDLAGYRQLSRLQTPEAATGSKRDERNTCLGAGAGVDDQARSIELVAEE
jgi:hypothetical protein